MSQELNRRLQDQRIDEFERKLEAHINFCHSQFNDFRQTSLEVLKSQQECTKALNELATEAKGVIELYNHVNGAIVIGTKVQKFGLWLLKWPVIGYGLYHILKHIVKFIEGL